MEEELKTNGSSLARKKFLQNKQNLNNNLYQPKYKLPVKSETVDDETSESDDEEKQNGHENNGHDMKGKEQNGELVSEESDWSDEIPIKPPTPSKPSTLITYFCVVW